MVLSIFQTNLQKQLMNEKWPTCIRGIVYDVESKFQMEKWSLCKQCGLVHSPRCAIDQTTTKYPSQPKEQFIFKRRQKRMHLLFAYREQAEIGRWNIHLEMKFAAIKSKTDGPFTESEDFIRKLEDDSHFKFYFCDCIARVYEEISDSTKRKQTLEGKITELTFFSPPFDVFMTLLINLNSIIREDGDVKYEKPSVTAFDNIAKLIPK